VIDTLAVDEMGTRFPRQDVCNGRGTGAWKP